jgi:DNA-binding ferritin-like protein
MTALGGSSMGRAGMAANATRLDGDIATVGYPADQMAALAGSRRSAVDTAENLGDMATCEPFIEAARDLDEWLWFPEAHLTE